MKYDRVEWRRRMRRQQVQDEDEKIGAGCVFLIFLLVLLVAAVIHWGPEIDALFGP